MKNLYLKVLGTAIILSFIGCSTPSSKKPIPIGPQEKYSFPEDWYGRWSGQLHIFKDGKQTMEVEMKLIIKATEQEGKHQWSIIYGPDTIKGLRDYYLLADSSQTNHYIIDEGNSIYIDGYVYVDVFQSTFEVMGSRLSSFYRRDANALIFEITSYNDIPNTESGGQVIEGDTIPVVKSYDISTYQKALLYRE